MATRVRQKRDQDQQQAPLQMSEPHLTVYFFLPLGKVPTSGGCMSLYLSFIPNFNDRCDLKLKVSDFPLESLTRNEEIAQKITKMIRSDVSAVEAED